jgi:uncharacterized protein (TIGR00255 family)
MIKSMTGFGRGEYTDEKRSIVCEIKSVNHRYCEINIRMPRRYQFAEEKLRAQLKAAASRGKIDVLINVSEFSFDARAVRLNLEAAKAYYESLTALKSELPELGGEPTLQMLVGMPEVLNTVSAEDDEEEIVETFSKAMAFAIEKYDAMKIAEGRTLIADILERGKRVQGLVSAIEEYVPEITKQYVIKMKERITEFLDGALDVPEDRVLLEAAVFADKSNVNEEIVRLKSHCAQLGNICRGEGPAGKKLDFLMQEMNRESNTIGSKANDIEITNKVLLLKAEIEKIREQVQNIE